MVRLLATVLVVWGLGQVLAMLLLRWTRALPTGSSLTRFGGEGEVTVIAWVSAWVLAQVVLLCGLTLRKRHLRRTASDAPGEADAELWPTWQPLGMPLRCSSSGESVGILRERWRSWGWLGAAACLGSALQLGLQGLGALLQMTLGLAPVATHLALIDAWQSAPWETRLLLGVCITVLLPLIEETVYRGWLFDSALQAFGRPTRSNAIRAAVFSASVFALLHLSLLSALLALPAGLLFVWIRLRARSLAAAIVAHGSSNAFALLWAG